MAESGGEPTNSDIINCLKAIKCRLGTVDKSHLLKNLRNASPVSRKTLNACLALETRIKGVEQRVDRLEHATQGAGFAVAEVTSLMKHLEKERDNIEDDIAYRKSQLM
ncbi:hypothetical protein DPMN_126457 [Dreissena polymorpha]|uniref:Uncharacterized protein n=1 Tax=Dreissena polymorpha TaxID=45954 RepID=A0A9D4GX37_DREPO|nr:hypothetical protein DPMN_126457 [Dreissena polymorpha]